MGRTSGGVRKDGILHPWLPRCCQNNPMHIQCPFTLTLPPTTCLTSFLDLPRWLLAPSFSLTVPCRFLSGLVKCIAEGSSRLCPEALAFHILAALLFQPHLLPIRPISPSQSPRKHSYSCVFFPPHLLRLLTMACSYSFEFGFLFLLLYK